MKGITNGVQDYWVSSYSLAVAFFGKIVWLFSPSLIGKRSLACAPSLLYDNVRNNYTSYARFEEHCVRDMVFINYVLDFMAYFMLLLRLYS